MKIWTIKEGEPLPIPETPGRQMRCGIVSEMLAQRGHDVTWWTSDFFHQTKLRLRDRESVVDFSENYRLHMLHPKTVYSRNVSLARIRYSRQLGKEFRRAAAQAEKPDVIVCSYPLIDLAYEAVTFGKENHIPVIVDIRDLWPDIIWERFKGPVGSAVKVLCSPLTRRAEYAIDNCTALLGIVPKSMEFAKSHGRTPGEFDGIYYLAYQEKTFSPEATAAAEQYWRERKLSKDDFIVCWLGVISTKRTDFCMVADVIAEHPEAKFVICGDGPSKEELENKYKDNDNIIFTGFIDHVYLETLMKLASVGVVPIRNTPDFTNTINNKIIEYMAGSLCVGTTLSGLQKRIVEENELGFWFESREGFAEWLERLMKDPALLQKLRINARHYYEENFRAEEVYGKYCELVEKLGAGAASAV